VIPYAALWLFALVLGVLAAVARARAATITFAQPIVVALCVAAVLMIVAGEERQTPVALGVAVALACLIVCTASDLGTGLIFDAVTTLGALAVVIAVCLAGNMRASIVGTFVCAGSLLGLYAVTRGRGIGLGDVKLGALIGAGCGGVAALEAIGAAFVAGAVWTVPLLLRKRARAGDRVAFAPFLALGTLVFLGLRSFNVHG